MKKRDINLLIEAEEKNEIILVKNGFDLNEAIINTVDYQLEDAISCEIECICINKNDPRWSDDTPLSLTLANPSVTRMAGSLVVEGPRIKKSMRIGINLSTSQEMYDSLYREAQEHDYDDVKEWIMTVLNYYDKARKRKEEFSKIVERFDWI